MKLIIAIIQDQDEGNLSMALIDRGYRFTKLATTGGFLKQGNTSLLLGVEDEQIEEVVSIMREECSSRKVQTAVLGMSMPGTEMPGVDLATEPIQIQVGGATLFVLNVEEYIHF